MNFEESRLRTFINWPTNAPVDARRIAKAGFYYTGQNLEVQCFSCGGRISEWNYNDKVMTLHRSLDPKCPFVLSPARSGNVPVTNADGQVVSNTEEQSSLNRSMESDNSTLTGNHAPNEDQMYVETARLTTFVNWPISFIVAPEKLAKAGFYYVQQGDKVRCAFCSVIIGRWEAGDCPLAEHSRHSPSCSFFQSHSSSTMTDNTSSSGIVFRTKGDCSDNSMKSLGVQSHKVAKHPKYTSKESRLATYTTWPQDVMQTPDDLAEAGFYYAGSDDQVRCFHCDGSLRKWEPSDDPWVEHARWFHDCGFIVLIKGHQFISDAIEKHPPVLPELVSCNDDSISRPTNILTYKHQVTEEELERLMNCPTAMAVLQIGVDFSRVKMAIRHKMEQSGLPFSTADDLIEATLDIQLEEMPYQDCEEIWSTPLHSPERRRPSNVRPSMRIRANQASSQDSSDSSESESVSPLHQVVPEKPALSARSPLSLATQFPTENRVSLEEENRRLREARMCKICMDNEVCIVFLPCGHLVTCVSCAQSLAACPVCRHSIKATVRTFLS